MENIIQSSHQKLQNPWSGGLAAMGPIGLEVPAQAATFYCYAHPELYKNNGAPATMLARQIQLSFNMLESSLVHNGFRLSDVSSIHFYTVAADAFFEQYHKVLQRLQQFRFVPFTTLKEVKMLSLPGLLFELEATATK